MRLKETSKAHSKIRESWPFFHGKYGLFFRCKTVHLPIFDSPKTNKRAEFLVKIIYYLFDRKTNKKGLNAPYFMSFAQSQTDNGKYYLEAN